MVRFIGTVALVAMSGCAGAVGPAPAPGAPATARAAASSQTTIVALYKKAPINNLLVELTPLGQPGKVLAKGTTNAMGRVTLRGSWTKDNWLCASGTYVHQGKKSREELCRKPFPETATLDFQ